MPVSSDSSKVPQAADLSSEDIENDDEEWETEDEEDSGDEMGKAVKAAHELGDPLEGLETFDPNVRLKKGKVGVIRHFKVNQLSDSLIEWLMDLMVRNMSEMYKKSDGGWKPKAKKKEMTSKNSRYLIFFIQDKPVAFSHFQFDVDYGREVLYCYEAQVESELRSCGLGKLIMETLEKIAKQTNLSLVVLTVFKFNLHALEFYKRLGYTKDETCPGKGEKKDYLILSKNVL